LVRVKSTGDGFELTEDSNVSLTTEVITADAQTVSAGTDVVFMDTGGPAATLNLDESNFVSGQQIIIKDRTLACTANNLIIGTVGAGTIDGGTYTLATDKESVTLVFDGTNFNVV